MGYTAGRVWIESLRIDTVNHILGLRLNVWTSIVVFSLALAYFVIVGRRHPGRETDVEPLPSSDEAEASEAADEAAATPATGDSDPQGAEGADDDSREGTDDAKADGSGRHTST
jgi:hypothetical protein